MILVNRTAIDLTRALTQFEAFQNRLKSHWVPHFMRLHIQQMQKYHLQRQEYRQKPWYQRLLTKPPVRPKLRRYTILFNHFYQPTWKKWLKAISSTPEKEIPIYRTETEVEVFGKKGEQKMVHWLANHLDDEYLGACRLYPKDENKADIDVIVIGPKGCWFFEVKNWKGHVQGDGDNDWTQTSKWGNVKNKPSPIWVWKMVAKDIGKVLRPHRQKPAAPQSFLKIYGGVVFTTSPAECHLDINDHSGVKWGFLSYWQQELQYAKPIKGANSQVTFKVLEALLRKHQSIVPSSNPLSTIILAQKLIQQTEHHLNTLA